MDTQPNEPERSADAKHAVVLADSIVATLYEYADGNPAKACLACAIAMVKIAHQSRMSLAEIASTLRSVWNGSLHRGLRA